MNRREQVIKAIHFKKPDYIPIFIFDGEREDSDIIQIDLERFYLGPKKNITEWGYEWDNKRPDIPMGAPINPPISSWNDFKNFKKNIMPDAFDKNRFSQVEEIKKQYNSDRYYMGSLYLTGFTIMSFLRGFCNYLEDLYTNRDKVEELSDLVFGFENDIISQMPEYGFDGVSFWDDWGTQTNMFIDPKLWRKVFKPRYTEQFKHVHSCGLDVFFHTCGVVNEIIPDLIETGVDMLMLGQPDLNGIEEVGKEYGGKVCFVSPVSYQSTSLSGTPEDINNEVGRLVRSMGRRNGGFIGFIINYYTMGMSEKNYNAILKSFKDYKNYFSL
jgi:uroporphyrinogen-III decarboxylase